MAHLDIVVGMGVFFWQGGSNSGCTDGIIVKVWRILDLDVVDVESVILLIVSTESYGKEPPVACIIVEIDTLGVPSTCAGSIQGINDGERIPVSRGVNDSNFCDALAVSVNIAYPDVYILHIVNVNFWH